MNKEPQVMQSVPEVFPDDKVEITVTDDGEVKKTYESVPNDKILSLKVNDDFTLDSPRLPEYYNRLSSIDTSKVLSKNKVYSMIEKFTPYLIQNLLYLSQHPQSSPRDRAQATKILIDKILPNLEASQIQLDTNNLQSLVIVKAKDKTE